MNNIILTSHEYTDQCLCVLGCVYFHSHMGALVNDQVVARSTADREVPTSNPILA